jgi:hypothetical protein
MMKLFAVVAAASGMLVSAQTSSAGSTASGSTQAGTGSPSGAAAVDQTVTAKVTATFDIPTSVTTGAEALANTNFKTMLEVSMANALGAAVDASDVTVTNIAFARRLSEIEDEEERRRLAVQAMDISYSIETDDVAAGNAVQTTLGGGSTFTTALKGALDTAIAADSNLSAYSASSVASVADVGMAATPSATPAPSSASTMGLGLVAAGVALFAGL